MTIDIFFKKWKPFGQALSQDDNVECHYREESLESKQESNLKFVTEEDSHEEEDLGEVLILTSNPPLNRTKSMDPPFFPIPLWDLEI
ncbi:hypothetical protein DAPPUDRAFT_333200 [Daphnia pulex]|uniref:Uncharacterized protein n=1 Tax=Daphnia pulex TaxID=6669 RepID=E9HS66_DAPPU|nr:hypothetical protein DAPPUDRAFT_333200 [Daphnia pulex]|eukprot:EFX65416.1 hypothetical protein DAPPUDRAFT_333200 [Daphnia pulex]